MASLARTRSALERSVVEYRFTPTKKFRHDIELFLSKSASKIIKTLKDLIRQRVSLKFQISVNVKLAKLIFPEGGMVYIEPWFPSSTAYALTRNVKRLKTLVDKAIREIIGFYDGFIERGSGWVLIRVLFLSLKVTKAAAFSGGCGNVSLPKCIQKKRACVTMGGEDNKCFIYAILAGMFPKKNNAGRRSYYRQYIDKLNLRNIKFPVKTRDVNRFERQNNVSVNVFAFGTELYPYYVTEYRDKQYHVNLLLHKNHYFLIKNLSAFMFGIIRKHKSYICNFCLCTFSTAERLNLHSKACTSRGQTFKLPEPGTKLKFRNFAKQISSPFILYADLETLNLQETASTQPKTLSKRLHQPVSFGLLRVCVNRKFTAKKPIIYRGADCIKKFYKCLRDQERYICRILCTHNEAMKWDNEAKTKFAQEHSCYVCHKRIDKNYLYRDHCHITGRYRGAICNACNLTYASISNVKIPVVFHNGINYDMHFLIRELNQVCLKHVRVIPRNSEKYLTLQIGDFSFIDSYQFLGASLAELVRVLLDKGEHAFHLINEYFPLYKQRRLMLRKGTLCYGYLDSLDKFKDECLPEKDMFFNDLSREQISDEDYAHAKTVWSQFQCKTLGDYHDIYLKSDVLLLGDIFENFRSLCMDIYGLDPSKYLSAPQLGWDACLKMTGVKLDMVCDMECYEFIEKSIRGGVSMVSKRFARANNAYESHYDPRKPNTFLYYIDCNSLYGFAMCERLPIGGFNWLTDREINNFNVNDIPDNSDLGYLLEVDLGYPPALHDKHACYPLAPEKMSVHPDLLSPMARDICQQHKLKPVTNSMKLIPNLYNKTKYIVHYKNLKLYLKLGLELLHIHRILEFRQEAWMKPYIDLNTTMRQRATNEFESQLFKILNNSCFGKSIEGVRGRTKVKFVNNPDTLRKLASKPTFHSSKIFNDNLVGVQTHYANVYMDKPIYVGTCILEISKHKMFDFHYNVIQPKFGPRVKLLYTDTDSFMYEIETEDLYRELYDLRNYFDFSNYPKAHFLYDDCNRKVAGYFKDETAGVPIVEFCGLKAKMYSFLVFSQESTKEKSVQKAKGVVKATLRQIKHDDYIDCLMKCARLEHDFHSIMSKNHQLYTLHRKKVSLSAFDDKRYLLADNIHSLPYGHYLIRCCRRRGVKRKKTST